MWPTLISLCLALSGKPSRKAPRRRPAFRRPLVEILEDRTVLSTFTVTNTLDDGSAGSLRWAINQVNADTTDTTAQPNTIDFAITAASDAAVGGTGYNATTGVATIKPLSALPDVTNAVLIDGYTQGGASPNTHTTTDHDPSDNAVLKIVLDGSQDGGTSGNLVNGLTITAGSSTVRGLVIDEFGWGYGIDLNGAGNDLVAGNFIGTDATGTNGLLSNGTGVWINFGSNNNIIGGTTPGDRNVISGNNGNDVGINGNSNLLNGNIIGLNAAGEASVPHVGGGDTGVGVSGTGNFIGGTQPGARNVISGHYGNAIFSASGLAPIPTGQSYLTATATVATPNGDGTYTYGDSSQFSAYLHVTYIFSEFLAPLHSNLAFGLNRVIPIKFQLTDFSGNFVSSLSAVTSLQVLNAQGTNVLTNAGSTALRYDSTSNQFVANWQTKGLPAGTYTVTLVLADGTTHTVTMQLTTPGSSAAQVAAGSDSTTATAGALLGGNINLYVDNSSGLLTADELPRINDAVVAVDATIAPTA